VKALSLDTISEDYAGLEKALQLVAGAVGGGDLARGGQMFRQCMRRMARNVALVDEAKTGRRRQKVIASRPRPDDLNSLIFEIVKQRGGSISEAALLDELREHVGHGVIETINDEEKTIEWLDRAGRAKDRRGEDEEPRRVAHDTPFSALKDRLS